MGNSPIFFAQEKNPNMLEAFKRAQNTFPYFWRELSWEYRRIVPALNVACVKVAFSQESDNPNSPIVEHMWINNIDFDGDNIRGVLINKPNQLTNVQHGDAVEIPAAQISDWLFAIRGKTYGGFTVQAMRADMDPKQRKGHDKAWGLDFGDYNDILVAYEQKEKPENLIEHPMSINMEQSFADFIKENPDELVVDEFGYNLLHRETIAGNLTSVTILVNAGMDKAAKTNHGKTALDFAKQLNWTHIIPLLEK